MCSMPLFRRTHGTSTLKTLDKQPLHRSIDDSVLPWRFLLQLFCEDPAMQTSTMTTIEWPRVGPRLFPNPDPLLKFFCFFAVATPWTLRVLFQEYIWDRVRHFTALPIFGFEVEPSFRKKIGENMLTVFPGYSEVVVQIHQMTASSFRIKFQNNVSLAIWTCARDFRVSLIVKYQDPDCFFWLSFNSANMKFTKSVLGYRVKNLPRMVRIRHRSRVFAQYQFKRTHVQSTFYFFIFYRDRQNGYTTHSHT